MTTTSQVEFGLDTFGDVTLNDDGTTRHQAQVLRDVMEEAELADSVGVDFIGVGEHHRPDFAISAPEVILAAIAARTERLRLGSAVTVLSSDDPIRVFQRFATVDAVSNGRAEIILGRGSFIESFPLFGYDLDQYEVLFEEKLALFAAVRAADATGEAVSWSGTTRAPLEARHIYPRTESGSLRTWIGVGGSRQSVMRAARYGFPLILAIIGGDPRRFSPFVELYHRALEQFGRERLPVGAHSPGYIGESDAAAREEFWLPYRVMHEQIGAERGWPPLRRADYDREIDQGALYVGSVETVARKIAAAVQALGLARFGLKYSAGTLSHARMMACIERYGREVIPRVRSLLAEGQAG